MRIFLAAAVALFGLLALAAPASAQGEAEISLWHGVPGVEVDVFGNDEVLVESFVFRDAMDLSALAGQTISGLQLREPGSDTVILDVGDVELPRVGNHTVIAHLDADATPTVTIYENSTATVSAGDGRLSIRHTWATSAVDILLDGQRAVVNLENGQEATVKLLSGPVSIEVVPAGEDGPSLAGPEDVTIDEGRSTIVYAVGSESSESALLRQVLEEAVNSAPAGVETGDSPLSSTEIDPLRTFALVGFALLIGGAALSRRRGWQTS